MDERPLVEIVFERILKRFRDAPEEEAKFALNLLRLASEGHPAGEDVRMQWARDLTMTLFPEYRADVPK